MKTKDPKALERATVILQVRSGQMTATQGASALGISRKTYYQWEKRALNAMMTGLEEELPGRPAQKVDPKLKAMEAKIASLETQLKVAEQTAEVRAILMDMRRIQEKNPAKKKKRR